MNVKTADRSKHVSLSKWLAHYKLCWILKSFHSRMPYTSYIGNFYVLTISEMNSAWHGGLEVRMRDAGHENKGLYAQIQTMSQIRWYPWEWHFFLPINSLCLLIKYDTSYADSNNLATKWYLVQPLIKQCSFRLRSKTSGKRAGELELYRL